MLLNSASLGIQPIPHEGNEIFDNRPVASSPKSPQEGRVSTGEVVILERPSNIMIDDLARREESLGRNHNSTGGIEISTSENKLMGTGSRLSAIATSDNCTCRQDHT
jgi:hypothetical protein